MWECISNSLFCRFLKFLYDSVCTAYSNSFINKFFKTVSVWNQNSSYYKVIHNFINRSPKYTFSVVYSFLEFCGQKLDKLVNQINYDYSKAYKNSLLNRIFISVTVLGEKYFGKGYKIAYCIILTLVLCTYCFFLPKTSIIVIIGVLATILILRDFGRAVYLVGIYPILYSIAISTSSGFLASMWDELLIIFCIAVWFYRWLIDRRDFSFGWTPVDFPVILLFVVSIVLFIIGSLNKIDFDNVGFAGLRASIEYLMFFFIVIKLLRDVNGAKKLIKVMIFTGIYMSIIGIYQVIANVETPSYWTDKAEITSGPRAYSIVGNPNVLGCLLVMIIPFAVSLIFSEKLIWRKFLYTMATGLMGVCLIFTGSRSSWIALGLALFIYALLSKKYNLIIALVVFAGLAYTLIPSVQSRINYLLDPAYIVSSFKGGRFARWPKAYEMFLSNLFFGVGFGQFGGAVATNYKVPNYFYVDNYYLKIAVEMGIFGLITFLIALYNAVIWTFRAIIKTEDNVSKGIIHSGFGALIGILFTNIVLNNFDAPSVVTYFWTIVAICVYLGYTKKGSPTNVHPSV